LDISHNRISSIGDIFENLLQLEDLNIDHNDEIVDMFPRARRLAEKVVKSEHIYFIILYFLCRERCCFQSQKGVLSLAGLWQYAEEFYSNNKRKLSP